MEAEISNMSSRQGLDINGYRAYLETFYSSLEECDEEGGGSSVGSVGFERKQAAKKFLASDSSFSSSSRNRQLLPLNLNFFRNLMISWNQTGTLPPLSDEENAMLSTMFQIWSEHRNSIKEKEALKSSSSSSLSLSHQCLCCFSSAHNQVPLFLTSPLLNEVHLDGDTVTTLPSTSKKTPLSSSAVDSPFGSNYRSNKLKKRIPLSVAIAQLREKFSSESEFRTIERFIVPFLSHIEILVHAEEPTGSQARDLLKVFGSNFFSACSLEYLESKAGEVKAMEGENSTAHSLALACLYDFQSRHLRSPAAARMRAIQLYVQAAGKRNAIATMQLAEKYSVEGEGWTVDLKMVFNW